MKLIHHESLIVSYFFYLALFNFFFFILILLYRFLWSHHYLWTNSFSKFRLWFFRLSQKAFYFSLSNFFSLYSISLRLGYFSEIRSIIFLEFKKICFELIDQSKFHIQLYLDPFLHFKINCIQLTFLVYTEY